MKKELSTRDRILTAARHLIARKGFKETTTKKIAAAASVSEMSVFRHFGSKKEILRIILQQYSFLYPLEQIRGQLCGDLTADLLLLAKMQYQFNAQNEEILLIRFQERQILLDMGMACNESGIQLKDFLVDYFNHMLNMKKIRPADPERLAIYFMSFNFGLFCNQMLSVFGPITTITKPEEIRFGVNSFVRSIQP